MIRVAFDPHHLPGEARRWWESWQEAARRATDELVARVRSGDEPRFDRRIWAELRRWLFDNVFHGKCAYCEGKVTPQAHGDAEHWRPKRAVTVRDDSGRPIHVERDGARHPGYWWLAYDWPNLLPACRLCNAGHGKQTQFPVARQHVFEPDEVPDISRLNDLEEPLLLHPFHGPDPAEHLSFDDLGHVSATDGSAWGMASIEVFHLSRGPLQEDRRDLLRKASDGFARMFIAVALQTTTWAEAVRPWVGAEQPYSLAVQQYMDRQLEEALARYPKRNGEPGAG